MLTRLRPIAKKFAGKPARILADKNVHPNMITLIGLLISILVPFTTYYIGPLTGGIIIILSAYFDVLDGEVARIGGKKTMFGAFLDSTIDRVEDALYSLSLIYVGINPLMVVALIVSSYLISYTRARAEALGVKMEGIGIVERAERVIMIAVALLISVISLLITQIIVITLIVLSIITVIQRVFYVYRALQTPLP